MYSNNIEQTSHTGEIDQPRNAVNTIGRSNALITKVNKQLANHEHRLGYGDPDIALDVVSEVAAHYEGNPDHREFVDRAYEIAAYLGGASAKEIAIDPRMSHITDKRRYGAGIRDTSIKVVATLAAERVAWIQDNPSPAELEEQGSHEPTLTKESVVFSSEDIGDVVSTLYETRALPKQFLEGILVLFEAVDTTKFDEQELELRKMLTRRSLSTRIHNSGRKGQFPLVASIVGSARDGIAARSMDSLIAEYQRKHPEPGKGEGFVRGAIARELTSLFDL